MELNNKKYGMIILYGFLKYPCLPPAEGATNQIINSINPGGLYSGGVLPQGNLKKKIM